MNPLTSNFDQSLIKKRIDMLSNRLNPLKTWPKFLLVAALIVVVTPACMDLEVQNPEEESIEALVKKLAAKINNETELTPKDEISIQALQERLSQLQARKVSDTDPQSLEELAKSKITYARLASAYTEGANEYIELGLSENPPSLEELEVKYAYLTASNVFVRTLERSIEFGSSPEQLYFPNQTTPRPLLPTPEELLNKGAE